MSCIFSTVKKFFGFGKYRGRVSINNYISHFHNKRMSGNANNRHYNITYLHFCFQMKYIDLKY